MRKYALLREPCPWDQTRSACKIMFYASAEGIYLFAYSGMADNRCFSDRCYSSLEELHDDWDDLVDGNGWIELEDPLPDCQQDAFIPLRVKGRDSGNPEWGEFETLQDGKWVEYRQ